MSTYSEHHRQLGYIHQVETTPNQKWSQPTAGHRISQQSFFHQSRIHEQGLESTPSHLES